MSDHLVSPASPSGLGNAPRSLRPSPSQFLPKLVTVLQEGYSWSRLGRDAIAGLTVAIVALPLAMGIAIASGTSPDRGLFTAIIAGFVISAFGGSRYQIGGPTAAFIVVVYRTIERHGYDGLALATLIAGAILLLIGFLRLGSFIKYVPYPVTIGFTAGIGVTILVSQLADLFGLKTGKLPGDFLPKLESLWQALPTNNPAAIALSAISVVFILALRRYRPNWPGLLLAVVLAACLTALFHLDVVTIGSRFGAMPSSLPWPALPALSLAKLQAVLPDAVTIAVLAGIESLLSAVVADGMTGGRHRSNGELVAQGIANLASPFFGGLPATGAIARTATNIRSGSTGPVSGILHAVFLIVVMAIAAPLMAYVPLAVLAAILAIVAWNMSEAHVVLQLFQNSQWGDRIVLLATLLLTVFYDLTVGIEAGVVLSAFLFMHKMAGAVVVEGSGDVSTPEADLAEDDDGTTPAYPADVTVYRINGPFFFGAASEVAATLGRIGTPTKRMILDLSAVPMVDSTGAAVLKGVVADVTRRGGEMVLTGVGADVRASLARFGLGRAAEGMRLAATIEDAIDRRDLQPL